VNDPVLVSGFEGFGDLFQDWQRFFDRYLALRNPIGERGALNQLEDESRQPGRLFETVDVADVLVIQCGEALGFSLKAGDALSVRGKRIGEDLDCDIPIQLRIPRAIHLAHAAGADERDDFIRAESGASHQRHELSGEILILPEVPSIDGSCQALKRPGTQRCQRNIVLVNQAVGLTLLQREPAKAADLKRLTAREDAMGNRVEQNGRPVKLLTSL
jgi:hypothetical protein